MGKLFGTNGIRGVVNEELNPEFVVKVGLAIGTYFGGKRIAIGRDSRKGGEAIKEIISGALMATGNEVVDLGMLPTPALQYYVKEKRGIDAGVMITASHNPPEYNGIKVIWSDGTEIPKDVEAAIEEKFFSGDFKLPKWKDVKEIKRDPFGIDFYISGVLRHVKAEEIRKREFSVLVDPGNGAACESSPKLLEALGAKVYSLNSQPNGLFPARMPEPTPDHIWYLGKAVKDLGVDFGVAHDGDADRAIFVDDKGRILGGEYTLAMLAGYMVKKTGKPLVVTPVSSSRVVEEAVKPYGGKVIYTKVGAPIVARKMMELGDKVAIGGEENGGIIYPPHQYCRDGAMAIALMMQMLLDEGRSLSELYDELPHYVILKEKVHVSDKEKAMEKAIRVVKGMKAKEYVTIDGIKAIFDDSWILVRPSGTEPLIRIFVEAESEERARELLDPVLKALKE